MLIWYVNKTHKSNIYGGRRMPYPLPSTQDSNLVKPSVVRNYNKFLLLVCRKVKKKRQHCILAIERMSTHTSCLCFYSFDWLVCPFLPSYMCKLYIYMSASKYLVCERLQLLTVCLCVCVGVCVSLHACVTEPWLGLSGSDPSMAGIRIQGFSIPLCVCVCVSWREVGSRCSHGWHRATPSTSLPPPPSPTLSESTMGDPVKQYRPRNKALYRASDTLSLKEKHSKTLGGWNRNRKLISNPPPLYSLPVTPLEASGVTWPRVAIVAQFYFVF